LCGSYKHLGGTTNLPCYCSDCKIAINMCSMLWLSACLQLLLLLQVSSWPLSFYNPVLPEDIHADTAYEGMGTTFATNTVRKFIPQIVFISQRDSNQTQPGQQHQHHIDFIAKNPHWKLRYYDNAMKDEFMRKEYFGTSILWAYELVNKKIGKYDV